MDSLAAVTELTANAIKVANELKARLDKAPKPAQADVVEKAAAALLHGEWVKESQLENAKVALSDHNQALKLITELATKASEAIDSARMAAGLDPRLSAGAATPSSAETPKSADDKNYIGDHVENEHDRAFMNNVLAYRQMLNSPQG